MRQLQHVLDRIRECGYQPHLSRGTEHTVIGAVGNNQSRRAELEALRAAPGVEKAIPILPPFKLVSREFRREGTVVEIGAVRIGGGELVVRRGRARLSRASKSWKPRGR